ncbi:hypothetical protein UFOVP915_54, partial [uncultured Caudovirales phage]
GTLTTKPEGGSVTYQDAIQGTAKRYIWQTFGLAYRITQEMYDDDLYGVMGNRMAKALGRSGRNNAEIIMAAPYNNAFSTSYIGFESGVSLCSTSHTTLRGATIANRPAADADFGLLAFQAAIEHFATLTDESGIPAMFIPKLVVFNPGDQWIVNQVLKSQLLPGTNQNDINVASTLGVQPHMSHYLTDADSWFVVADQHDVNYFERRPFTFSNADDFDSGDAKFKGTTRRGSGFGDWRGIYGSQGA